VLRFQPPYIIERTHIDTVIQALDEILTQLGSAQTATHAATHAAAGGTING
jgi:hypothetical protein